MNRVAIVVLNWNGIEDTLLCLDSLIAQDYKDFQIIVIDNGSVDDSVVRLEEYLAHTDFPIELICEPKNTGFAGGVNIGIRRALESGVDGVALFNNDAIADQKWLSSLVNAMKNEKIGITTGLLLHQDGKTIDSTGDWFSIWGLPFPRNRGDLAASAPNSEFVFSGSGGASLYRTTLLEDIGLFDEAFFAYYEDVDLSFRAQLAGWRVFYTPDAIAYHQQGATSSKLHGFGVYQTFKNLPLLFLKDVPTSTLLPVGSRFYLAYWLILLNAIKKGMGLYAIKGLFVSFILGFGALRKRVTIQRNKRVSTTYIKGMFWNDLPPTQPGIRKFRKLFTGRP